MANTDAPLPLVDTHVHIFAQHLPLAAGRRYAPGYDATPQALIAAMDGAGVAHAMLVQPSFLGTDNSYLLAAIAAHPRRFSGVAVIEPDATRDEIAALKHAGVCGVRLNLIGTPGFLPVHAELARRLAAHEIVLQIQAEGAQWAAMRDFLSDPPGKLLIDHFGRTAPGDPSGGFETLMAAAGPDRRLYFKFSAPYRLPEGAAQACAAAIIKTAGCNRIVWGSDWPHTQFEGRQPYAETLDWLGAWVTAPEQHHHILVGNPARLYDFSTPPETA